MEQTSKQHTLKTGDKLSVYIIDKFITFGGMNTELYLAHIGDDINKKVCLKIISTSSNLDQEFWNKYLDEIVTLIRLGNKKNIIQTFAAWIDDSYKCICISMEYVQGSTLLDIINNNGPLSTITALKIFHEILVGVAQLHNLNQKIIHRDLKPENILISDDLKKVTIIDFGISSVIEKNCSSDNNNKSVKCLTNEQESFYGTYSYIIPDVIEHNLKTIDLFNNNVSVQFDFYSLGIILYEMLLGEKPFHYDNDSKPIEIIRLPLKYDMKLISSNSKYIPTYLENIIFRCIASKKEDRHFRYSSIDEIIKDVDFVINNIETNNYDKNNVLLLKPIKDRVLQDTFLFDIDKANIQLPFYKHWYFFIIVIFFSTILTILFIVMLLIKRK